MKQHALGPIVMLAACFLLTGCDDLLVTTKLPPIQDDRVMGVWANPEDPTDLGIIGKRGDGYAIRPQEPGGEPTLFTLSRAGDALFAQIEEKCANHVFSFRGDSRTCYQIVRLDFDENSMTFRQLDPGVFEKIPDVNVEYRVATSHPKRGDSVTCALIESPGPELLAFLASLPSDSYKAGTRMLRKE
ncbi:MAG: hypothetical protein ABIR70_15005 [Bryobacteraceae bacterium]